MFIIHYFAVVVSSTNKYVTTQSETTNHPAVFTSIVTIFSTTTRISEYLFEAHNYNYDLSTCKVESIQNNTVQLQFSSHIYVSADQCTCDPVASQSADISLAGQFVLLYLHLLLSSAIHCCSTSVCVDNIIIDWTHFSCSNNILDETETQTSV